jgi:hypothetical protein
MSVTAVSVAPDYAEAIVGWRAWSVVQSDVGLRLCSPCYTTIWAPFDATRAGCRRRTRSHEPVPGLPTHDTIPEPACRCGIYAATTAWAAASFSVHSRMLERHETVCTLLGRVRLWGRVVESERGWRGELAYPSVLYVRDRPALWSPNHTCALDGVTVARALAVYGVQVELVPDVSFLTLAGRFDADAA